jgi:uncharacterized membrane protein (DUF485 family)
MSLERDVLVERIKNDPQFQELVAKRSGFAWLLSAIMLLIYFSFILIIAFKSTIGNIFGTPLAPGMTMTVGIPVGVGVIVSAFVLTGIYVARANTAFDALTQKIKDRVKQ